MKEVGLLTQYQFLGPFCGKAFAGFYMKQHFPCVFVLCAAGALC